MAILIGCVPVYLFACQKRKETVVQILCGYVCFMFFVECSSYLTAEFFENNLFFSHIYFWGQVSFLGAFYLRVNTKKYQIRTLKIYLVLFISFLGVYYLAYPNAFLRVNEIEAIGANYLLLLCSLFFFLNKDKRKQVFSLMNYAVLVWSVIDLAVFLFGNILIEMEEHYAIVVWLVRMIGLIGFYSLFLAQGIKFYRIKSLKL